MGFLTRLEGTDLHQVQAQCVRQSLAEGLHIPVVDSGTIDHSAVYGVLTAWMFVGKDSAVIGVLVNGPVGEADPKVRARLPMSPRLGAGSSANGGRQSSRPPAEGPMMRR